MARLVRKDSVDWGSVTGTQMGRIKWDVKDCMRLKAGLYVAVKEEKRYE